MSTHEETLSSRDYTRLRELVYAEAGIALGTEKKQMLEVRIKRRLRALQLTTYGAYCEFVFGARGRKEELVHLIDAVTTNKTDFFREPRHFEFLVQRVLPELSRGAAGGQPLLVWSAGCSTGEEPYTLAMLLSDYAAAHPGFRFRILATDVSTTVLHKAEAGVYAADTVSPVPAPLRQRYLMRSRDPAAHQVRVVPELRALVEFRRLNFMDADYGLGEKAQAIFCRNVIIYFDRPTQERILGKLAGHLAVGGYLFVGHSETLHGMDLPLAAVAPALYRRLDASG